MKAQDFPVRPVLEYFGVEITAKGKAICKWHADTTPSLSVTQFGFRCWSCGKSGDAISLVREEEGLGFTAAVARCEEITGTTNQPAPRTTKNGWWGESSLLSS